MWYKIEGEIVNLRIIVKPNAKRTQLIEISDKGLKISLHAKPHEGEANAELIEYLAKLFRQPKSHIKLIKGSKGRKKLVSVTLNPLIKQMLENPLSFTIQFS